MRRNLERAVVRRLALVLTFAYTVKYVVFVNLLGESLACELLDISLQRRYAEHLPARKPVADGACRKTLKKALLACKIHMNAYNKLARPWEDKRLSGNEIRRKRHLVDLVLRTAHLMLKHLKRFLLGVDMPRIKRLERIKTLDWILPGCIFRVSRSARLFLEIDYFFGNVIGINFLNGLLVEKTFLAGAFRLFLVIIIISTSFCFFFFVKRRKAPLPIRDSLADFSHSI